MSLTTNIVAYWKLDESSGNAADQVNGNTLTNNNTATYGAAVINNGVILASASNQTLSIADGSQTGLNITGDFSYSFWVNTTTTPSGSMCLARTDNSIATEQYFFLLTDANNVLARLRYPGNVIENISRTASPSISNGTWYHFVFTVSHANTRARIYQNGAQLGADFAASGSSTQSTTAPFILGNDIIASTNSNLNGKLDEMGIWTRELTASEASQLYNGGAGLAYPFGAAISTLGYKSLLGVGK